MNEPSPRLAEANDMELATTRSLPLWRTARILLFSRTGGSAKNVFRCRGAYLAPAGII